MRIAKQTSIAVCNALARRGMKQGDLSKFIEDAVRWIMLEQTVAGAHGKFADVDPADLAPLIDQALAAVPCGNIELLLK